jgi:hypothetical protein
MRLKGRRAGGWGRAEAWGDAKSGMRSLYYLLIEVVTAMTNTVWSQL